MTSRPRVYVLTGCTASGKTAAALAWAEVHAAEIVSCDSLLFYRGMDIGTAKPTPVERARVPHHLIDILDVDERMDVGTYAQRARAAMDAILARGRIVLVTGGSGFYLQSFFAPVVDAVPVDANTRKALEEELAGAGLPALVRRLEDLNPQGLGSLDTRNSRRVVRALERCLVSGRPLVELQAAFRAQAAPFAAWDLRLVELAREPEELRRRIRARTEGMLAAGLVDEVRVLLERGLAGNPSAARAIGYRETLAWLAAGGRPATLGDLTDAIAQNTWRLVRKQRTWFRTQLPEHRIVTLHGETMPALAELFE